MSNAAQIRKQPFSPGPWQYTDENTIYTTEGLTIADVRYAGDVWKGFESEAQEDACIEECEGNGTLIAAAPALLQACKAANYLLLSLLAYRQGPTDELLHEVQTCCAESINMAEWSAP